jgi:hypothetical protein
LVANPEEHQASDEMLRASEGARRLGIPAKELLRLVYNRQIGCVMVKDIAHIPRDAIDEYRAQVC